ncbi:hypothetical protein V2O64_11820 [Verrucomicrobiaceae bacterium 227]
MEHHQKRGPRGSWRNADKVNRDKELNFETPAPPASSRRAATLLTIVAGLVLTGLPIAFLIIPSSEPTKPNGDSLTTTTQAEKMTWEGALPKEVLKKFQDASRIEEKLSCLKFPEIVQERARTFFTEGPGKTEKIIRLTRLQTGTGSHANTRPNLRFLATMEEGKPRVIILSLDPKGPKIDFDFYARYCAVPWDDLVAGHVDKTPEMRLLLQDDHYNHGEYADKTRWHSLKGTSPDLEQSILVYLDRNHPDYKVISNLIKGQNLRANVALKATQKGREQRQFEITKVNALNWMTIQAPPAEPDR